MSVRGRSGIIGGGHVAFVFQEGEGHAVPAFQLANLLVERYGFRCTMVWIARDEAKTETMVREQRREGQIETIVIEHKYERFIDVSDPNIWRSVMIPKLHEAASLSKRPFTAVIGDFALVSLSLLKDEFRVPTWRFFVSPLIFMSLLYEYKWDPKLFGSGIDYPDIGMVEPSDLPQPNDKVDFVELCKRITEDGRKCDGILVNDCQELFSADYFKHTTRMVPVQGVTLTVGPLAAHDPRSSLAAASDDCISWLNSKPPRSVVFCALGSAWILPPEDACTFANCNAKCGRYVLWAHRKPDPFSVKMASAMLGPKKIPEEFDAATGLPRNYAPDNVFLAPWVNQPAVLTHPAVACFVSHCGWNSAMEAMTYGVPLVCLPITSDQPVIAKMIDRHLRNGKAVWYGPNFETLSAQKYLDTVTAVCSDTKYLQRAREIQEIVRRSVKDEGSSSKNLDQFVHSL